VRSMVTRSDDPLATLLLTNHLTETDAAPFGPKGFWDLVERVGDPGCLLGVDAEAVASLVGDQGLAERVLSLLDAATRFAFALERFESQGFVALTPFDESYPPRLRERLGSLAPPVLFVAGPVELLSRDAIGIVGSRNVEEQGAEVAEEVARVAVAAGLSVVSGGARGVDQRSMSATYRAGGSVIGFLAESLDKRVRAPETRRVITEGVVCLATPFKPDAGFTPANAMARNKLIYTTARTTLVVACDEGHGGTWEGALEAMRRGYGDVAVWRGTGEGPGNEALVARGGRALTTFDALLDELPLAHTRTPEQMGIVF
jgi:predicted Rossmann fold nucleotide-binding protein DprA/Smf involved in DNA uptake